MTVISARSVPRLLVVWCPGLLEENESGRPARAFARVVEAAAVFSPLAVAVLRGVCAVPTRGPSRYFGGDDSLVVQLAAVITAVQPDARFGVADGLFAAIWAARTARSGPLVVPPGGTPSFLADLPIDTLGHPDLADLLHRLGIHTLGRFASLPTRHVLARLGSEGALCQAVARGERGELGDLRLPPHKKNEGEKDKEGRAGGGRQTLRQPGFWGEAAAAELRAGEALRRAVALLHPEEVVVGRLQGGRGPAERARLVPWSGRSTLRPDSGAEPWPGQLPPPSPVIVPDQPIPAELVDSTGATVEVSAGAVLGSEPARLSVHHGQWTAVHSWAGPWPIDERWWSGRARRRRARVQVVTDNGAAYLLMRESGRWWMEGAYD